MEQAKCHLEFMLNNLNKLKSSIFKTFIYLLNILEVILVTLFSEPNENY